LYLGYSKLASNLAQKGSIGPELLSNSMNGYLDKMIKIIISYKGDLGTIIWNYVYNIKF